MASSETTYPCWLVLLIGASPFGATLAPTQPAGSTAAKARTRTMRFLRLVMLPRHGVENPGFAPILAFPYSGADRVATDCQVSGPSVSEQDTASTWHVISDSRHMILDA